MVTIQCSTCWHQVTNQPRKAPSAHSWRMRGKHAATPVSSTAAPSASGMSAAKTLTTSSSPSVSTRTQRLRPVTFLPPVEAPLATHLGGLDGLGVQHGRARLGLSARLAADLLAQDGVQAFQGAVLAPLVKGVADRGPGAEVLGQ